MSETLTSFVLSIWSSIRFWRLKQHDLPWLTNPKSKLLPMPGQGRSQDGRRARLTDVSTISWMCWGERNWLHLISKSMHPRSPVAETSERPAATSEIPKQVGADLCCICRICQDLWPSTREKAAEVHTESGEALDAKQISSSNFWTCLVFSCMNEHAAF